MIPASGLRTFAGPLVLLASACATPVVDREAAACGVLQLTASNYAEDLAHARTQQMQQMRFASEEAMIDYIGQTRHLQMEALRVGDSRRLIELSRKAGAMPDYVYEPASQPTFERVNAAIAAADACAAKVLQ